MNQSRIFLDALFASKPDELYLLIWTLQGDRKRSHWFRDVRKAAASVDSLRGCNVYVGIGLSPSDFGECNRCKSEDVAGIIGIGVDIDMKSPAHPHGARPASIEQALSVLPPEFPPSIIVETGNGIQVWWLFKEPCIFDSPEDRRQAAALSLRWQTLLQYAAQSCSWVFERLGDLARVLRVPGTQNVKDPGNPKNVVIRSITDRRYNPSDFSAYLDDRAIPDEDEKARAAQALSDGCGDKALIINLAAAMADEQLARWMEQYPRFRDTWNHRRTDMQDVSQSGYDQALANFAVRNGQADQQIVDLIIHNRRLHGAKQSKDLNYYRRTISKAQSGAGKPPDAVLEVAASDPKNPAPPCASLGIPDGCTVMTARAADPNARARLCELISTQLGVQILRIVKLNGQDPVYLMELSTGSSIHFPDAARFISQRFVKTAIAASAGKMLPRFKPAAWEQLAQMMLDACTDREGTDDLELKGYAKLQIDQYLAANPVIASPDRLTSHDLLAPVIDRGRITVSSTHMQVFINKSGTQNLAVKAVATMIIAAGGEAVRFRRGPKEQSRWALPLIEWNPKDYSTGAGESSNG